MSECGLKKYLCSCSFSPFKSLALLNHKGSFGAASCSNDQRACGLVVLKSFRSARIHTRRSKLPCVNECAMSVAYKSSCQKLPLPRVRLHTWAAFPSHRSNCLVRIVRGEGVRRHFATNLLPPLYDCSDAVLPKVVASCYADGNALLARLYCCVEAWRLGTRAPALVVESRNSINLACARVRRDTLRRLCRERSIFARSSDVSLLV